jgi:DNA-directed RNA polymerase specialized sigma24 family protein
LSRNADFDDLYARTHGTLLVQLYAYCGDPLAAQDALAEAFVAASRHWHRIGGLASPEVWVRGQAIRRLDAHHRRPAHASEPVEVGSNAHLVRCLAALAPTSRRLLLVRRIDDTPLPVAAREVGLTDAAAEQVLARASTALHGAGIDTTPNGMQARLAALRGDVAELSVPSARDLRRTGTRRRYALTGLLAVVMVAVVAGAGQLTAARPSAEPSGTGPTTSTSTPGSTGPTTPTAPPAHVDAAQLLVAPQLPALPHLHWTQQPTPPTPPAESVYGACAPASANPPPDLTWTRDFTAATTATTTGSTTGSTTGPTPGPTTTVGTLRQVIQLAPSVAEAKRAFRQVAYVFGACPGQHLDTFDAVHGLGERSQLVAVRQPGSQGIITRSVLISQSGPVVNVLVMTSAPGQPVPFTRGALTTAAATAVGDICRASGGACARPPLHVVTAVPPSDKASGRFLTPVDLPLVAHVPQPWTTTKATSRAANPSATACDDTDFAGAGGANVLSRVYVIPGAARLPTLFGLSETIAQLPSAGDATALLHAVADHVAGCHQRQLSLTVLHTTSFDSPVGGGTVWEVLQKTSKKTTTTFRVALVRAGARMAEVTFTPGDPTFDVDQTDYVSLARRAMLRLTEQP